MSKLVLNPTIEKQIGVFSGSPSHALLLVGPSGSGKLSLAKIIAETILDIPTVNDHPYTLHIAPAGPSIGIESIRQLEQFLSLKVPGQKPYKRVVIIEEADRLTTEGQNALLKNLEEPPLDTILILTAAHLGGLLPTIRSRTQTIIVGQPSRQDMSEHFSDIDQTAFNRAYIMSGGRPGLLSALIDDEEHPLKQATEYARELLGQPLYNRLLRVDELARKPDLAANVTLILQHMAHVSLQTASGNNVKRWKNILEASYRANEALASNGQPKLVLTNLMLSL